MASILPDPPWAKLPSLHDARGMEKEGKGGVGVGNDPLMQTLDLSMPDMRRFPPWSHVMVTGVSERSVGRNQRIG